ncbi:carboxypeptidase M32 [Oleisolibacter albus]|uniref:carboxypeptidase M32 n=1 Tax=Oleisolibacter albus TaxID=2171757 RepID=UPI000DF22341|nr:carboxypeptidase M32 [Oleisolibacter albus]
MSAYTTLERRFARQTALNDAIGILDWDSQTTMPDGAADGRAGQLATLRVLAHEAVTAPDMPDLLAAAEAELAGGGGDDWRQANLREMRRHWVHAAAVPPALVEASSRAVSAAEMIWRTARADNDFAALLPALRTVVERQREIAAVKAAALGVDPYDALLDEYEPGGRAARIDGLFDRLGTFLPDFTAAVLAHQAAQPAVLPLPGPFPVETQRQLGLALMRAVGFDFSRGRLDVSLHPFCGGATDDVRITTRYDEADATRALMGVLHESGHALYEQGRPRDWLAQPVGAARSMSLHESQSLLIEMQAGRSRAVLTWLAPLLRQAFGGTGPAWETDNLYRLYTRVERSLIRVDADEVTYPAHVILRYRLERAMIGGDLDVADLPGAWAEGMDRLVGVVPPDDRQGCLQDIHWSCGLWGYFPTYTLGAMTAAQLFDAARRVQPDLEPALSRGDFSPLVGWLRRSVHGWGSLHDTDTLLTRATGSPLDADIYMGHLRRRYLGAD